jgi:N-methylhydantoinase A
MTYLIGVDVGGTFTDLVLLDLERHALLTEKVLSTPDDQAVGVVDGLDRLATQMGAQWTEREKQIAHATTVVGNAIIERKGAKTALLTTHGFRDVLAIGREVRFDIYDLQIEFPEPLVPRHLRIDIRERIDQDGQVLQPLDEEQVQEIAVWLRGQGVESTAVCFLHSYRNPQHEYRVRELLQQTALEMPVSLSADIAPEIREYERTSTTAINAYVKPIVQRYLSSLLQKINELGFGDRVLIMLSNGGLGTAQTSMRYPVRLVESGAAAAALAATVYSNSYDEQRVLAFDMGGTTAKACLVIGGDPLVTTEGETARAYRYKRGSGLPVKTPLIDMIEIGSGGGSLAHIDQLGLLRVGPESAGADPGPVCYGLGGTVPTVTDADLVLGYLNPDYFLGGRMPLSRDDARQAIEMQIAQPLNVDLHEAAWHIHDFINENMAISARIHSVERGQNVSDYTMVAFGGAGPVHAYGVARKLGIKKVVLPYAAGVTAAYGLLAVPISFDFVRSFLVHLNQEIPFREINSLYEQMEGEARKLLREAGVEEDDIKFRYAADMRYVGQGYEIRVPLSVSRLCTENMPAVFDDFTTAYRTLYGQTLSDVPVEVVSWRLFARGPVPTVPLAASSSKRTAPPRAPRGEREVFDDRRQCYVQWPVYDRYALSPGTEISGPAIIEEIESTIVVGPYAICTVSQQSDLLMTITG